MIVRKLNCFSKSTITNVHPLSSTYLKMCHSGSRFSKADQTSPSPQKRFPVPGRMHFGSTLWSPSSWKCLEKPQMEGAQEASWSDGQDTSTGSSVARLQASVESTTNMSPATLWRKLISANSFLSTVPKAPNFWCYKFQVFKNPPQALGLGSLPEKWFTDSYPSSETTNLWDILLLKLLLLIGALCSISLWA